MNGGTYSNMNVRCSIPAGPITSERYLLGRPLRHQRRDHPVPGIPAGSGTNSTNINTGFPWTTGMIYRHRDRGPARAALDLHAAPVPTTGPTSALGNITLVSGGISYRNPKDSMFIQLDKITMTLAADNVPSISPSGIAALVGLMVVGAGYASRRRFGKKGLASGIGDHLVPGDWISRNRGRERSSRPRFVSGATARDPVSATLGDRGRVSR